MGLFSRLYKKKKSGAIAKQRLKTLLVSDRADCSMDLIDAIKGDIGASLSKYMEVDMKHMNIDIISTDLESEGNSRMILVAKIPFREINKVIC